MSFLEYFQMLLYSEQQCVYIYTLAPTFQSWVRPRWMWNMAL